jgi:alanine-glyoxylate transaminase/serine-glyoxylate transaminase/serine-pyruvate transaminase
MTSVVVKKLEHAFPPLDVPQVLMLGPGPSNVDPRVLNALGKPLVGHLDPFFVDIMEKIKELLKYAWQTSNQTVVPMSGTGSCAMEAAVANLVEPGDIVLVAINGYFGERIAEMALRCGAVVKTISRPWGTVFTFAELEKAIKQYQPKVLAIVHAETSTGACQPLEGVGDLCKSNNCYLLVDTVTSLGGVPLFVDAWGIDACYSGTQKCLGVPPGLSPLTFSDRAMKMISSRKTKIQSWYMDITLINSYWATGTRAYHHTAPITMNWGLYEGLRVVAEEGLENRWKRHRDNAEYLWKGLQNLGLECLVDHAVRLPSLTTVKIPADVDPTEVIKHLRSKYLIEVSGGLGELKGKVLRIGLMGYNSKKENVDIFLKALEETLKLCKKKDANL